MVWSNIAPTVYTLCARLLICNSVPSSAHLEEKTIYLLVGSKGSGKTHIGKLLEQELGIVFLRVEERLIDHQHNTGTLNKQLKNDGYDLEENWINEILHTKNEVISEATGSSAHLAKFIRRLESVHRLKLIRIYCPLDECFIRVKKRSTKQQYEMSDEKVHLINAASHKVELEWALEIDNTLPASHADILASFNNIRRR